MLRSLNKIQAKVNRITGILGDKDIFTIIIIILVSFSSFGLGRISKTDTSKIPIVINTASVISKSTNNSTDNIASTNSGKYVASKNGAKYHYPWCPGAQRIKEANKVWFDSVESAKKAGYTPASNCKGL